MKLLDDALLADLTLQAAAATRLRHHYSLHDRLEDPCQRMLIAIEPGSYVRPHRHLLDPKPECLIGLRGRMALITFDDAGEIQYLQPFGLTEKLLGVDIPAGIWHTVVCLQSGSVFFETKPGPYRRNAPDDLAPWAPEEGSPLVRSYLKVLVDYIQTAEKD